MSKHKNKIIKRFFEEGFFVGERDEVVFAFFYKIKRSKLYRKKHIPRKSEVYSNYISVELNRFGTPAFTVILGYVDTAMYTCHNINSILYNFKKLIPRTGHLLASMDFPLHTLRRSEFSLQGIQES